MILSLYYSRDSTIAGHSNQRKRVGALWLEPSSAHQTPIRTFTLNNINAAVLVENTAQAIMVTESAMQLAGVVRKGLLPALVTIASYMIAVLYDGCAPTGEDHSTVISRQIDLVKGELFVVRIAQKLAECIEACGVDAHLPAACIPFVRLHVYLFDEAIINRDCIA
jgi:hypothetical protein